MSQILLSHFIDADHSQEYFVSGFNVILPTLIKELSIPQASEVWPSSAFALVSAAFLLPFGRLSDMYGGYPVYLFGLAWFSLWSLIAGFSQNNLMLVFCRALQGLGPAAFLPSGLMLMGSIYRPGPRKNLVFSIYGGAAPLGFFTGVFVAGLTGSFLRFGWYFWIGTILVISTIIPAIFTIPSDMQERKVMGVKMDWLGSILIVSGLILVIFALNDASHAPNGWKTPYIYITLILGSLILGFAFYVEAWVASSPLIPFDLFQVPHLPALFIAVFFLDGVLGIFLLYATLYMQDIHGRDSLASSCLVRSNVHGWNDHLRHWWLRPPSFARNASDAHRRIGLDIDFTSICSCPSGCELLGVRFSCHDRGYHWHRRDLQRCKYFHHYELVSESAGIGWSSYQQSPLFGHRFSAFFCRRHADSDRAIGVEKKLSICILVSACMFSLGFGGHGLLRED